MVQVRNVPVELHRRLKARAAIEGMTMSDFIRRELVKVARHKGEDGKVSIRSVRRHAKDALDKMARDGEVGEDDVRRAEAELEKITGRYTAQVDEVVKAKEAELLEV